MIDKNNIDLQIKLCKEFSVVFNPPGDYYMVGVADNVKSGLQPINGLHHQPEGQGTGWFVWAGETLEGRSDFFKPVHYIHLPETCPQIMKFLGFPPGWRFLVDDKGYEDVWFDENLLKV
jgi:hypothetical protein